MGSAINTAYRIESYTVSGQILISPELYARVHDVVGVQGTIEVQFKGVEQPLTLYDIRGMAGPYQVALRDTPQEGLDPAQRPARSDLLSPCTAKPCLRSAWPGR